MIYNQFRQNFYLIIGISIGLLLGVTFSPYSEDGCFLSSIFISQSYTKDNLIWDEYEPRINLAAKPLKAQRSPQKLLRPRYFSTELGIREKLFVGVLTTQSTINTKAIAINKTSAHLVDKLVFFIDTATAGSKKLNLSYLKLPGIVGFVDTRSILKPFHVLKYIKDNYIDNYDFFFIIKDSTYFKARKLYDIVQKISVSQDIYASTIVQDTIFCSLDSGILLSHSVLQKVSRNIDWCVNNAFSEADDDNFGRCVLHSTNQPCHQTIQGYSLTNMPIRQDENYNWPMDMRNSVREFEDALTLYPIHNETTFYQLHLHFTQTKLDATTVEIDSLRQSISNASQLHADSVDDVSWPIGNQPGNKPNTRFDVLRWDYFNENYIYLDTDFNNIRAFNKPEKDDIRNVLNASIEMIEKKYGHAFRYYHLLNGYRRFDPSRGMDYKLDLIFRDESTDRFIKKRIEVCKPLGKVEILSVPYVTENRRVNIILPVRVNDKDLVQKFLQHYRNLCLEKKDKTFLMMVLLYENNVPGKGTKDDVFKDLKQEALILTKTFQKDDSRVAWVSTRLPAGINTVQQSLIDFAFIDLCLKKFTPDSLILIIRPNIEFKIDYLNRVRMNTIQNWQVYCPIPFTEYNPLFAYNSDVVHPVYVEINKHFGHYDMYNTQHISFYVKDYMAARNNMRHIIRPIRTDSDIKYIGENFSGNGARFNDDSTNKMMLNTIYSMFVRFSDVHVVRAVDPALRLKHQNEETNCQEHWSIVDSLTANLYKWCIDKRNSNLASRSKLAKLILEYKSKQQYLKV